MAGHNKWSKIKHKKAATDAKKSKVFSKLVRLIQVESRRAKGDVNDPGLQAAIDRAKKENMPKDNIERAIEKGAGDDGSADERITYEMYGPGGTALIIDTLTDNRNRTAAEIKHLLSQRGYELATPGAAAWAFERKGSEVTPISTVDISSGVKEELDTLLGALEDHDDVQDIYHNAA